MQRAPTSNKNKVAVPVVVVAEEERPETTLAIAARELHDSNLRIAGLLQEHRILRHLRFREENIRILKKDPNDRSEEQQERIDHLVAANQNRSAALPVGGTFSGVHSTMPKSIRATAYAGNKTSASASSTTTADAGAATQERQQQQEPTTPRRRRPIKSTLSHVINGVDPVPEHLIVAGSNSSASVVPVAVGGGVRKVLASSKKKLVTIGANPLPQQLPRDVLPRMLPAAQTGGQVLFDRSKHHPPAERPLSPSLYATTSDGGTGGGTSSAAENTAALLSAQRRAAAGHGRFKIAPPAKPTPEERQHGAARMMYVARELNKNSNLMRPGDQFGRSESYETVTQSLRRYEQIKSASRKPRTKFDVLGGNGDDARTMTTVDAGRSDDGDEEEGALAPPMSQTVVVQPRNGGPVRRFVKSGAYLVADRRYGQWDAVDESILQTVPSRGIPRVIGVNDRGYGLWKKPTRTVVADNGDDDARSLVSELTASSV